MTAKKSGWSQERRAKHAEAIKKWAPWKKSTGPKTPSGKDKIKKNAYKGGQRFVMREASRLLRQLKKEIKDRT